MYEWEGMVKISKEEAVTRWHDGLAVYLLYDDDSESEANSLDEIYKHDKWHDAEYGYEK